LTAASRPELALVRRIAAFANASDEVLSELIELSPAIEFGVGERLMSQSQRSDFVMIILSGEVTAFTESHHGSAPLAHHAAPTVVGEIGALSHGYRTASIVARTPVRAMKIERATLLRACQGAPEILMSVIGQLGHHIEAVNHALGLYAGGFVALERGDLDTSLLADLTNPSPEMRTFADAFRRLAQQIARERRQRDEMASAALIQRAMLPGDLSSLPLDGRCDAFGDMRAARDVGGDFYDVFMLDDDRVALTIGDVCGKGVPAALFMSQTMTTLRMAALQQASVPTILEAANAMLCAYNPSLMFTTAFCGVLDLDSGRFEYANCGHCPPLVLRRDGACEALAGAGTSLGLAPGLRIAAREITLRPGDGLFLYTDGVTESVDPAGEEYGGDRLSATLRAEGPLGAETRVKAVMNDVARFTAGADPFDDVTCLAAIFSPPRP
jgi:sigma-B regulation protein RsbU (phosphoserine phosphatase)